MIFYKLRWISEYGTILVVAEDTETGKQLLQESGRHAAGINAELIVLSVIDANSHTQTLQRTSSTQSDEMDSIDELEAQAEAVTSDLASDALQDIDVDYEVVSRIAPLPRGRYEFAEDQGCGHIYIVGERRSPTGKVLFGDIAQAVLLNFDGPVTVITEQVA